MARARIEERARPRFDASQAAQIARDHYGLEGPLRDLPGERDQSFRLDAVGGRVVLKLSRSDERRETLELQHAVLARLVERDPELPVPRVVPTRKGEHLTLAEGPDGASHLVRVLTWLPGVTLAEVRPHSPELLADLGRILARLDRALAGFEAPAPATELEWNPERAHHTARAVARYLEGDPRAGLVRTAMARFEELVVPALPGLRRGFLHNDANDHNVLVTPVDRAQPDFRARRVAGLIDFGDLVEGALLFDPAVACAYAALGKRDPLGACAALVAGYHAEHPLTEPELELIFPAVTARLALSVSLSARGRAEHPDEPYLQISEAPAWRALEQLDAVPPALAAVTLRGACGLEPGPRSAALRRYLEECRGRCAPVVERGEGAALVLDLSVGSPDAEVEPGEAMGSARELARRMELAGATVAIGRWGEPRLVYTAETFRAGGEDLEEWRTVHLGLDLFREAGAPVRTPLPGRVHSFADNGGALDYGPTVILEHETDRGQPFHTLYGHLSRESLTGLEEGRELAAGDLVGHLGAPDENGGWPPHVHFQVIADLLGRRGEFPGVAAPSQRELWLSLCPDPGPLVGWEEAQPYVVQPAAELRARRERHLGPSLSLSYRRPLTIVRGRGTWLFDEAGRAYLDAVNNVPHVGHSHPRVVEAAARQARVLNTNTRYLHPLLAEYTERLAATLPNPLEVVYLVCSGSEANELALRLVRAATGRRDVLVLEGAYHGNTGALVELSPYKFAGPGGAGRAEHVHVAPMPDVYRGPIREDEPRAGSRYAELLRDELARASAAGRGVAAFFCESLLGCGGQVVPPPGFLREAYAHARAAGALVVADEVQVGFGRVGERFWGFELDPGAVPDVVTLGKPIGNGHPLAAVVTTREIAEAFANGMEYFSTFGGNPVSCAVGLAVLDVIEEQGLQHNAHHIGALLLEGFRELRQRHPLVGDVRGAGLFLGLELVLDRATREPAPAHAAAVVERLRERGILISTDGPAHDVLKIKPPLVFDEADARRLLSTLDEVLTESDLRLD